MTIVMETARIPMVARTLWRKVGRFGAVGDWHPMLARLESEGDAVGLLRTAETPDGARQVERLDSHDPIAHWYRYRMQSTPMPVRDYVGEFRIRDEGDGTSTVIWSADYEASGDETETTETIRNFFRAGLDNLRKLYGTAWG